MVLVLGRPTGQDPCVLRVMTYNVRYFAHQHPVRGLSSLKRNVASVAKAIAGLDELPHVVALQEVERRSLRAWWSHGRGGFSQMDVFAKALSVALQDGNGLYGYRCLYFPAHSYSTGGVNVYTTGLGVLVRTDLEVLDWTSRDVTARRPPPWGRLKQTRICAHVQIAVPGGIVLDVFNTHLSLPLFFSGKWVRGTGRLGGGTNQVLEAERVASFVKSQASSDRFVVMGDFNSQPGTEAYRVFSEPGFLDVFGRAAFATAGFMHLRMRLDHIFHGRGLSAVDHEGTHAYGDVRGQWHGLSDHVPLVARFTWSDPSGEPRRALPVEGDEDGSDMSGT
ncbi:MAG: endonuclease/exonuclease/phosphatase family protein [Myxococcota bacterium]